MALVALALPAVARGNGDPASDVLIQERVFWPYSVKLPAESRQALAATVREAAEKGYRVRVALINNEFDLGSAGVLSRHPQEYSKFLAQELANFNTDWLLVVMPNGYGIYHCVGIRRPEGHVDPCEKTEPLGRDQKLLRSLQAPERSRTDLAAAGDAAVRELASLHGVSVGGSMLPLVGGIVAVVVLAAGGGFVLRRRRAKV